MAFNWFKGKSEIPETTKIQIRYPIERDYTEQYAVNKELTYGLYHNIYPGLKLSGALAYPPIAVPVWFMGIPTIKAVNEEDQPILDQVQKTLLDRNAEQIHTQCHREGTIWLFPKYDAKESQPIWEFISDDAVTIIKDLQTNDPIKIIVDEDITITTGVDLEFAVARRLRTYTKELVEVKYIKVTGEIGANLRDKTMRNVSGILPIAFSNNADGDEIRGHSDYERMLSDLKMYHDLEYQITKQMTKFNVKMVQSCKSAKSWFDRLLANNGWATATEIDISKLDFIINEADESTQFVFPGTAFDGMFKKLEILYKKLVESSATPEICWGLKTTGNAASVSESVAGLIKYCQDKQRQKTRLYVKLIDATIKILQMANVYGKEIPFTLSWNDLNNVSEETKAKMFQMYANGIASLVSGSAMTREQLHKLWTQLYPKLTDADYAKFVLGLDDMMSFNQRKVMSFEDGRDYNSLDGLDDPSDENGV